MHTDEILKHQFWFSFFSTLTSSWWVISLESSRGSAISAQFTILLAFSDYFFSATKCGTSKPPLRGLSFKPLNELSGKKIYRDSYQTPLFNNKPFSNEASLNFNVQRQITITQITIFLFVSEDFKPFTSAASQPENYKCGFILIAKSAGYHPLTHIHPHTKIMTIFCIFDWRTKRSSCKVLSCFLSWISPVVCRNWNKK